MAKRKPAESHHVLNGRKGGRPKSVEGGKRASVYYGKDVADALAAAGKTPSEALKDWVLTNNPKQS